MFYADFVLTNKSQSCRRSPQNIQVIINGVPIQRAINAFELQAVLPRSTVFSRVAIARKRGTYSVPDVIDVTNDDDDDCDDNEDVAAEESTTSPVTMPRVLLSPEAVVSSSVILAKREEFFREGLLF